MDEYTKIKKKRLQNNRWHRIEKKHINSIKLPIRLGEVNGTYLNYLRNKTFFKDYHIKLLNGEKSLSHSLDPNLVMDIRHEKTSTQRKQIDIQLQNTEPEGLSDIESAYAHPFDLNTNDQFNSSQLIDDEIKRFQENVEIQRPAPAFDFFEYLNSHTKYKYIRAKFNRHLLNDENLENQDYALTPVEKCEYECGCKLNELTNENHLDDEHIHTVCSEYIQSPCEELSHRLESINNNFTACDLNQCENGHNGGTLKIELIPKYRIESFKLCGIAANIENSKPTDGDELNVIDAIDELKPMTSESEAILPAFIRNDNEKFNKDNLVDNLQITQISLDTLKMKPGDNRRNNFNEIDMTEVAYDDERNAIICEIFCEKKRANFVLLQKYFLKWFHYSTIEKLSKEGVISVDQTRLQKIQKFLQNITIERKMCAQRAKIKAKSKNDEKIEAAAKRRDGVEDVVTLTRKYNSKIKLQQDIIGLQRIKLERQERMMTEMKLSKLSDEAKEAQVELKKELRQVIQMGCQPSRSKARCLQMIGNLKEQQDDDEYAKLQAKGLAMPRFLLEMQARALERETKHQQARERREVLEQEKEGQRVAVEESKRLQDEETKRQRIEELRKKRREEKLRKMRKEQERLAYVANLKRAEDHYRRRLLQKAVFGFKHLIIIKRCAEKKAQDFRFHKIRLDMLHRWKQHVDDTWRERKTKAEQFHNKQCMRAIMNLWKKFYLIEHSKKLVAEDWYDMKIIERSFTIWNCITVQNKLIMDNKIRQAEAHYQWNLKWRVMDHWRRLQVILRIERETESRRERWRQKIWELLPDYTPNTEN